MHFDDKKEAYAQKNIWSPGVDEYHLKRRKGFMNL